MIRRRTCHRRAFTLVELTLGMVVTTLLLGGLASAMVLASRALPENESVLIATLDGSRRVEQLAGELFNADAFTERTATSVQFTVPDRNADNIPETIRYSWSGSPGDSLVREYNGVASTTIGGVYDFALDYQLKSVTAEGDPLPGEVFPAQTVISLPLDAVSTEQEFLVSTSTWCGMYLSPDPGLLPPDTTRWKIERLFFRAKKTGSPGGVTAVQLRQADVNRLPTDVVYDEALLSESTLDGQNWSGKFVDFPNAPWFLPSEGPTVVFQPSSGTGTALILFQTMTTPSPYVSFIDTADAGGAWTAHGDQAMTLVTVNATVETGGPSAVVTTTYLTRIDVALQVGSNGMTRAETGIRVINSPLVTGP